MSPKISWDYNVGWSKFKTFDNFIESIVNVFHSSS